MAHNKYINKRLKDRAGTTDKFYYKRVGRCSPSKCQSACCRFKVVVGLEEPPKLIEKGQYHDLFDFDMVLLKENKMVATSWHCPYMNVAGRCKLHNKKSQPNVCKYFPMLLTDGVYQLTKKYCGYTFIKIKNENYKPIKARINKEVKK